MNKFLNDIFQDEKLNQDIPAAKNDKELRVLSELDKWSQEFWKIDEGEINTIFAQRGYEDKGYGHIERIIANVGDFLEMYFKSLYELEKENNGKNGEKEFFKGLKGKFKHTLILFYVAAHLHDIGMNFPGIFEALSRFVEAGGKNALHIGKIIHDYHHYASFIILMEMSSMETLKQENITKRPYLANIPQNSVEKAIEDINKLNKIVYKIYDNFFAKQFSEFDEENGERHFKVILAILCLLHKEVNNDHIRKIFKKFREKEIAKPIESYNRLWSYLERARQWTDRTHQRFLRNKISCDLPESNDYEVLGVPGGSILDPLLTEALLQYGDKTEITIARLARQPVGYHGMPLKIFRDDTQYDYQKRSICTEMAQEVISNFARLRACCYLPVLLITVDKTSNGNESNQNSSPEFNVVIHYLRFDGDEGMFKMIRFQDEKDFFDLQFLHVIRFHLPLIIHLCGGKSSRNPIFSFKFKKKEHLFGDKNDLGKLFKAKNFPFELKNHVHLKELLETMSNLLDVDKPETLDKMIKSLDESNIFPKTLSSYHGLIGFLEKLTNKNREEKFQDFLNKLTAELKKEDGSILFADDFPDTLRGLNFLIKTIHEDKSKGIPPKERFPYTPLNRKAIDEAYRFYQLRLESEGGGKEVGKIFYETCDLTVPANFEIMAVLNLFWEEEG